MDICLSSNGGRSKKSVHNDMCLEYAGVLSGSCDEQCAPVTYLESEI
jgi:hypothetical protein